MKRALAILLLAATSVFAADPVVIGVTEKTSVPCAPPVSMPQRVRVADGSFEIVQLSMSTSLACFEVTKWREEWTAYPDRGGTFIRRIEKAESK